MTDPPRTWRELADRVRDAHPACLVVIMDHLTKLAGGERTHYALPDIQRELSRLRIGHIGAWPTTKEKPVALYDELSPTGEFIQAVIAVHEGGAIDYSLEAALGNYHPVDLEEFRRRLKDADDRLADTRRFIAESMSGRW